MFIIQGGDMKKERFKILLASILPKKLGDKPHKALALASIIEGIDKGIYNQNKFYFDEVFRKLFTDLFKQFATDKDRDRPYNPFFHLRSSGFWFLKPRLGHELELESITTIGGPGELMELVEYAYLDDEFYEYLFIKDNREEIKRYIFRSLQESIGKGSDTNWVSQNKFNYSKSQEHNEVFEVTKSPAIGKFPHEQKAIATIIEQLKGVAELIPNYYLHDPSNNQYLECDIIVISQDRLAIVELKHWTGEIDVRPNKWIIDGKYYREDPHINNIYKCKVLKSLYEKLFPYLTKKIWVESIVVLTNPDAIVIGEDSYKTDRHNPTFGDIESFVKHYKYRSGAADIDKPLKTEHVKLISKQLRDIHDVSAKETLNIPGYEILENLTKSPHIIELLARPKENQLHTVKRFRIFCADLSSTEEMQKKQQVRALNSLKAIERIGDHSNIAKLMHVPNPDGLVIEASDWSQEGTLADVLEKRKEIPWEETLSIIKGIVEGLKAVHSQAIIHRNLQPENILIVNGIPKLINFELSYILEDERLTVFPETTSLKSSPYLAPELYTGKDFSEATDLFSVGVLMYTMVCGAPPFKNSVDLKSTGGTISPQKMDELKQKGLPEELCSLIYSLVQEDRLVRIQNADEVLSQLSKFYPKKEEQALPVNRILQTGEVAGVYEIKELIGQGREAQVYRAVHASEWEVALKIFNAEVPWDRISFEINALKTVSSPYIIRYQTIAQWNDKRWMLVLGLAQGNSLRDLIIQKKRPDINTFKHVTLCLLEALKHMHRNPEMEEPLLHNDIKPENIIINTAGDPILIDFGTASTPHTGAYMGTHAYTGPDLLRGVDYVYCESGDLFALGVTLFEWMCGEKPYAHPPLLSETPRSIKEFRDDIPEKLNEWFNKAIQPLQENRFKNVIEMQNEFEKSFEVFEDSVPEIPAPVSEFVVTSVVPDAEEKEQNQNPFVRYLNTLHNTTAMNENALAESQAQSNFFGFIHIPLKITDFIFDKVKSSEGTHVILTGHAGDGKSTIALELYKKLIKKPMAEPLDKPLKSKEDAIGPDGKKIFIIKDLNELPLDSRVKELATAAKETSLSTRWCIVSNTGKLLETFSRLAQELNLNPRKIENELLDILERNDPSVFYSVGAPFTIINLSRVDNVEKSKLLLKNILNENLWKECDYCNLKTYCPINLNVNVLRESSDIIYNRIEWVYRRLYEYGNRLTMRQITAHLAYSITSGIDCSYVVNYGPHHFQQNIENYLFFNRFFGFRGFIEDKMGRQLTAIKYLIPAEFGSNPYLPLERRLWMREGGAKPVVPSLLLKVYENLIEKIRGHTQESYSSGSRLRQQLRRLLYIFGRFPDELKPFYSVFLSSPRLIEWETWQINGKGPDFYRREELKRKILSVLQGYYTSSNLSEYTNFHDLFIGLTTNNRDLRSSVQILLARIPFTNFTLVFRPLNNIFEPKRYILELQESNSKSLLPIDLPVLDFVSMREMGEIGKPLDASYVERLERFKAQLLHHHKILEGIELLELMNDGNLETKRFEITNEILRIV